MLRRTLIWEYIKGEKRNLPLGTTGNIESFKAVQLGVDNTPRSKELAKKEGQQHSRVAPEVTYEFLQTK